MAALRGQVVDINKTLNWMEQKVDRLNNTLITTMSNITSHLDDRVSLLSAQLVSRMADMHASWLSAIRDGPSAAPAPPSEPRLTPLTMCYAPADGQETNYIMPFDIGRTVLECKCEFVRRLRRRGDMPAPHTADARAPNTTTAAEMTTEAGTQVSADRDAHAATMSPDAGHAVAPSAHSTHDATAAFMGETSGELAEMQLEHGGASAHGAPSQPTRPHRGTHSRDDTGEMPCAVAEDVVLCIGDRVLFEEDMLYTALGVSPSASAHNHTLHTLTLRYNV